MQSWKNSIIRFLMAQTISLFGSSLVQYAILWHITLSTSSGKMLTIATLCGFVPQIAISLFAGGIIDRFSRKKLIMLADFMIAVSTLILALVFIFWGESLCLLFVVLVIRSLGTGMQTPAVNAIIPQIVPKENLMRVSAINATLSSLMMFISPVVSGGILSVFDLEMTLFIDVVTAAMGIFITSRIFVREHERKSQDYGYADFGSGLRFLKDNGFVARLVLFQIVVLFLISPSAFLTPLMVSRTFGKEVWRLMTSEMTYSLGMVLGGLLISAWGGFAVRLKTTLVAGFCYGLLMMAMGVSQFFGVYVLLNTLIGITSPCYNSPITVTIQERVEPDMQGRVFSFMQIASSSALPLGMLVFGPLSDVFRVEYILLFSGFLVCLVVVLFRRRLLA